MEAIFGPKVMIINEFAGSGGDAMPWLFRKHAIGPLVGMRTWGGLVGHYTGPADLIDGGNVATPNLAFYNLDGRVGSGEPRRAAGRRGGDGPQAGA